VLRQRTLQRKVSAAGIGLHSGELIWITIKPSAIDTGVTFRRQDLFPAKDVRVSAAKVVNTNLASTIDEDGVTISTVEHLMAALSGLGIDNVLVEISGSEIPIMDGSASSYVYLLKSAGIKEQGKSKEFIEIVKPIRVSDGDKWAKLEPFFGFRLNFTIDFSHPVVSETGQSASIDFETTSFSEEIARARTFGFVNEVVDLRKKGLALGGGLDNAIVLDDFKILNKGGLRQSNEFVMHKALDAIGDLHLLGNPILGSYSAFKSGHALNNKLIRAIQKEKKTWKIRSFSSLSKAPLAWSKQWAWN
jgi:UDP-3-O-[3-hydroxymyristoyl] N-acetylglucosamine deacetylase